MTDYLIHFHGQKGSDGCAEVTGSFDSAIMRIEEFVEYGCEFSYALASEIIDGRRVARDVTDQLRERLHERETERLVEAWHDGLHSHGHNFASLEGFLAVQDRHFPGGS